jgi:hypothetical protein
MSLSTDLSKDRLVVRHAKRNTVDCEPSYVWHIWLYTTLFSYHFCFDKYIKRVKKSTEALTFYSSSSRAYDARKSSRTRPVLCSWLTLPMKTRFKRTLFSSLKHGDELNETQELTHISEKTHCNSITKTYQLIFLGNVHCLEIHTEHNTRCGQNSQFFNSELHNSTRILSASKGYMKLFWLFLH